MSTARYCSFGAEPSFSGSTRTKPPIARKWPCLTVHFLHSGRSGFCQYGAMNTLCYHAPGYLLLYSSRISLAAKNCLTAQANTSSGAMIIQNINPNLFQRAFHGFGGGTFGCTEVHAHMIIVETQLQRMPNMVRCNGPGEFEGVSTGSMNTGAASTLRRA